MGKRKEKITVQNGMLKFGYRKLGLLKKRTIFFVFLRDVLSESKRETYVKLCYVVKGNHIHLPFA
jgi:hypothetical protein